MGGGSGSSGKTYTGTVKPLKIGKPNSTYIWIGRDGKPYQMREYDSKGMAKTDTDYSDHNRPDQHPKVPHKHDWDWSKNPPRGEWYKVKIL